MKKFYLFVILICFSTFSYSQNETTPTDSLVKQFIKAWNAEDIPQMISLLDPDAFFKSPFQLRYGRDTMAATVLITNPPAFKVTKQTETHSHIDENIAWSIGNMVSDVYDENGNLEDEPWHNDYVFVFTKKDNEDWKLQMMIFHE
jgi:hypothetical protein